MVRQDKTFAAYLENFYYGEISYKLKGYIYDNRNKLKLHTVSIQQPNYIALNGLRIMGVTFKESEDSTIIFHVAVQASLMVKGNTLRGYEEGKTKAWFTLTCSGVLCDGFSEFTIQTIEEYSQEQFYQENAASKFLVPYIHAKDMDQHAENFLKKYCPCALESPMPLPIDDILKAMGLTKFPARLPDGIFGRIYFGKETVEVLDGENSASVEVDAGTILVNQTNYFMENIGSENNTVIHECVHWEKHRKFFELQKLINPERTAMSCQAENDYKEEDDELLAELDWVEWQANALAPKILIPASTGRIKLTEILDELTASQPTTRKACIMEQAIRQFADFFNVSVIAAKIRAMEFGFEQAAGVLNYVDGRYCPPFSFKDGALKKNQTFVIGQKSLIAETVHNKELHEQIDNGCFIHVGGMLVVNDPRYVHIQIGSKAELTEYALEHADECCLVFNRDVHTNTHYDRSFYENCYLCRPADSSSFLELRYSADNNMDNQKKALKAIVAEAKRVREIFDELPASFYRTLDYHINRRKYSKKAMEDRTYLTARTIHEYRTNREANPALQSVLALCIGLNLHPAFSKDLIKKAGFNLDVYTEEYMFYDYLVTHHHMENIFMWNEKLENAGLEQRIPKNWKKGG